MFPQFVSREATSFILGNELGHSERLSFSEACQGLGWHCGVNRTASAIPDPVDPVSEGRCSHWLRGSLMHDNTEKINMAMDQYLWKYHLLGGWTSILTQLFWCELQGYYWFWPIPIWCLGIFWTKHHGLCGFGKKTKTITPLLFCTCWYDITSQPIGYQTGPVWPFRPEKYGKMLRADFLWPEEDADMWYLDVFCWKHDDFAGLDGD